MSTQDIKEQLEEYYPGEKFKRKLKAVDGLGYTHRAFKGSLRNIVVTTDIDEDYVITNVIEVESFPSSNLLKDAKRPWISGGPLAGHIYSTHTHMGGFLVCISEKYIWDIHNYISDIDGKDQFIEYMTGGISVAESEYEFTNDMESVIKTLEGLGAEYIDQLY